MKDRIIANHLLDAEAVTLSPLKPYTWVSGLKAPIYCDNRVTISLVNIRKDITNAFVEKIKEHFPEVDAIVGTATAGIPQACWIADKMDLPTAYVRSKSKEHGKTNQIEGKLKKGSKIIVIEDLISTGGSSILACQALIEAGFEVLGVYSAFTYEMSAAKENFEKAGFKNLSLTSFSVLIDEAKKRNYIDDKGLEMLKSWQEDPKKYSDMFQ
ncbi:MAG: orotate phosphoribosyltransferase [Tissierella sp.]|nr:orotate phosphoribosyltransferase [Tissierella sp.]